jgi:hypothetical protein
MSVENLVWNSNYQVFLFSFFFFFFLGQPTPKGTSN